MSKEVDKEQRRALVIAAVGWVRDGFEKKRYPKGFGKSQFSNLTGVCQQATSPEEIELYLRYQVGRELWNLDFQADGIERIKEAMGPKQYAALGVDGWRLYSVFATREYTYQQKCRNGKHRNEDRRG